MSAREAATSDLLAIAYQWGEDLREREAKSRELLAWYVAQHGLNSYAADGKCKCPHCGEARPLLGEDA